MYQTNREAKIMSYAAESDSRLKDHEVRKKEENV